MAKRDWTEMDEQCAVEAAAVVTQLKEQIAQGPKGKRLLQQRRNFDKANQIHNNRIARGIIVKSR